MLPPEFFNRKTLAVARSLIGKVLVRKVEGKIIRHTITETEAYVGPHDLACHSSKGRTKRCEPMFGPRSMHASSNIAGNSGKRMARNSRPKPPGLYNNACQ